MKRLVNKNSPVFLFRGGCRAIMTRPLEERVMNCLVRLIAIAVGACASFAVGGEPDFTKTPPKDLGVELVKPAKDDKTGFLVGGKNETALIRTLTAINGRKIEALEKDMRPGAQSPVSSRLGFVGK